MPKWLKIALAALAACIVLCLAGGFAVSMWFEANKDQLKAKGDAAKAEGEAFGKNADTEACLTEGLKRHDGASGIMDRALINIFVEHCLAVAKRPDDFCKDVPKTGDIMKSATWAVEQCSNRSRGNDQDCTRMMQTVQHTCHGRDR